MKALLNDRVVADSDDIVESERVYAITAPVRRCAWTGSRRPTRPRMTSNVRTACSCYDVVVDGGVRHSRAAWSYEAPRPWMQQVGGQVRILGRREGRLSERGARHEHRSDRGTASWRASRSPANLQRHLICPDQTVPGQTVRAVLDHVFATDPRLAFVYTR